MTSCAECLHWVPYETDRYKFDFYHKLWGTNERQSEPSEPDVWGTCERQSEPDSPMFTNDAEQFFSALRTRAEHSCSAWDAADHYVAPIDKYDLEQTCGACPEQYDVHFEGEQVGYLRLRHGQFTVECPDVGGVVVYTAAPNGDGVFEEDERDIYITAALEAIDTHRRNNR